VWEYWLCLNARRHYLCSVVFCILSCESSDGTTSTGPSFGQVVMKAMTIIDMLDLLSFVPLYGLLNLSAANVEDRCPAACQATAVPLTHQ
jgi:hypothetical protein